MKTFLFSLSFLFFISGCAGINNRYISNAETEIQEKIAEDLFTVIHSTLPPAETEITVIPVNKGEERLNELLRKAGYKIFTTGEENKLQLDIYHDSNTDTYIGTICIGLYNRFSRQYKFYPDGVVQLGATAIGN